MMPLRSCMVLGLLPLLVLAPAARTCAADGELKISWEKNFLRIRGANVPGGEIEINYLEAYCRPGSTDRDWQETVIGHKAEKISVSQDGSVIKLKDTLRDGVTVEHTITVGKDEVDFRL